MFVYYIRVLCSCGDCEGVCFFGTCEEGCPLGLVGPKVG